MPVQLGKDKTNCFARWGRSGKKYYYTCGNETARNKAKQKAYEQGIAIGLRRVVERALMSANKKRAKE